MKRIVFLMLCICLVGSMEAENNDLHLKRMIECINDSDFRCAMKELPQVQNWEYDTEIQNIDNALTFINKVSSKKPKMQALDSLRKYVANETFWKAVLAKIEMHPLQIIYYGRLTLELKKNLPVDEETPVFYSLLSNAYADIGNYSRALEYMNLALELKNKFSTTTYVLNLANAMRLYSLIGDSPQAQKCADEILSLLSSEEIGFWEAASCLSSVGSFYSEMGAYKKAEKYVLSALDSIRANWGEENMDYVNYLGDLAVTYDNLGEYDKAEQCYIKSLDIITRNKYENYINYPLLLQNIGAFYLEQKAFEQAEKYYLQALTIAMNNPEEYQNIQLVLLHNLGVFYSSTDDDQRAEQYFLQALDLSRHIWGENEYKSYVTLAFGLTNFYLRRDVTKATDFLNSCINIQKKQYIQSISFMSEKERLTYWNNFFMHTIFDRFVPLYSFLNQENDATCTKMAYDNELFQKGVLLRSSNLVRYSIMGSNNTTLIQQWNELTALKQQIFVLEQNNSQRTYINELKEQAEQLEKEITQASAAYRESQAMWNITWDSVRNHLGVEDVAIEYMAVPYTDDTYFYCALLLRKNSKYPELIPLFNENDALALINTSSPSQTNTTYAVNGRGIQLAQVVWHELLPYLKPGETVYFAPTGLLHQLAIEALPYDETHTMSDKFNLVRLSSTREIAKRQNPSQNSSAVLYGGIQYTADTTILIAESEKYPQLAVNRGLDNDTLDRGSIKYLPGSKTEVEQINELLRQNHMQVQLFTSTNANEESFKAQSGQHRNIFQIATHGFYWSDSTARKKDYFSQRMMTLDNDLPATPTIDPLNRCGLLFAGAQLAWSGHSSELPEGVQDGILTAKEISLLDLRDADLVVLSACETGRGEITGEGVFGLQRAFKMAGTQSIIMTLWPVNDVAAQLFMTEFYRNWITLHQSKREAFRNAQNTVRAEYEEPIYWAGFILLD